MRCIIMNIQPGDYRADAKALFDVLNTTRSGNGSEELDKDELAIAKQRGLWRSLFNIQSETISEENFIELYIRSAENESANPVRESSFNTCCENIKICYEDMKRYGQLSFGLESNQQHPECEVSMHTMESEPHEGMYTMFKGYKILYTNNLYVCSDIQSENSNLWGLKFVINQDIGDKKMENVRRQLNDASTKEERNEIIKAFVDDLPNWNSAFDTEFYEINDKTGDQQRVVCGQQIYFNIDDNYNLTFDYERIYEEWK